MRTLQEFINIIDQIAKANGKDYSTVKVEANKNNNDTVVKYYAYIDGYTWTKECNSIQDAIDNMIDQVNNVQRDIEDIEIV